MRPRIAGMGRRRALVVFGLPWLLAGGCSFDVGPALPSAEGEGEGEGGGEGEGEGGGEGEGEGGGEGEGEGGGEGEGEGGGPGCFDRDGDQFGVGDDCAEPDCDDANPAIRPGGQELCNGADDDCDGAMDEELQPPACESVRGVCAAGRRHCAGARGWAPCEESDYGPDYELDESSCDGLDNDCDGTVDEGCACGPGDTQLCGSDVGQCRAGVQRCADGVYQPECEGEQPPRVELCNGLDDDCDGEPDEADELDAPRCPLDAGVCAGSRQACRGVDGWGACDATRYGPSYQPEELSCDELDNDCDGQTDEQCECEVGQSQPCGVADDPCQAGSQPCVEGRWGECQRPSPPPGDASCDGLDDDCDGATDEDCVLPPALRIDQFLYDEQGWDGDWVYVELWGPPGASLDGLALEAVDGGPSGVYARVELDGERTGPDGRFVIVDEDANWLLEPLADLVNEFADLQNGPDSVRLVAADGQLLDAVGYGDFSAGGLTFAGEGQPAPEARPSDARPLVSLVRREPHQDSADNAADFIRSSETALGWPTVHGELLGARLRLRLSWEGDQRLELHLLRAGDGVGSADDCGPANPRPDWGELEQRDDDPWSSSEALLSGRAALQLVEPGEDLYLVAVRRLAGDPGGSARLRIDLEGEELSDRTVTLAGGASDGDWWWQAALIELDWDGWLVLEEFDEQSPEPPSFE